MTQLRSNAATVIAAAGTATVEPSTCAPLLGSRETVIPWAPGSRDQRPCRVLELDTRGRAAAASTIYHTTPAASLDALLASADTDIAERIRWLRATNVTRRPHAFR
jgi:hypothetical protein